MTASPGEPIWIKAGKKVAFRATEEPKDGNLIAVVWLCAKIPP